MFSQPTALTRIDSDKNTSKNEDKQADMPSCVKTERSKALYATLESYNKSKIEKLSKGPLNTLNIVLKDAYKDFLNSACQTVVDFGIGAGIEVLGLKESGYKIIGYDCSASALYHLQSHGVITRATDLNSVDENNNQLSYQAQIEEDLNETVNVISMRTLQYLEQAPLILLLFSLLNNAKPGSIFFFVNVCYTTTDNVEHDEDEKYLQQEQLSQLNHHGLLKGNLVASFFSPRVDIEFLRHERRIYSEDFPKKKHLPDGKYFDEILAMRKR